ncbi:YdcF family protein [Commensalibacter nepenthis]|uniref:YdcF family protein n=1 Tax=Commensalibacter nepenthis TaxID=3043872 RepID=A0ABT6Q9R7_9PROT|nr:YdcF family protein [Commensalibacter sp. TBRC 10068]MDI2112968.1 YdcF family protein [Commensalibacter sp. TBRC 10068]
MTQQPILVFGAALNADGIPKRALIMRIEAAIAYGKHCASPLYIVTGGNPQKGMTEAEVMKRLLIEYGVSEKHIICETQAKKTIQSVVLCSALLKKLGFTQKQTRLVVVSSAYHLPRCCWLLILSGWRTRSVAASGNASRNFYKCWSWRLREIPAIVWNSFRILFY